MVPHFIKFRNEARKCLVSLTGSISNHIVNTVSSLKNSRNVMRIKPSNTIKTLHQVMISSQGQDHLIYVLIVQDFLFVQDLLNTQVFNWFDFNVSSSLIPPLCWQEADWYFRRHKQELELLLVGSQNMGVEYTEGVGYNLCDSAPFG